MPLVRLARDKRGFDTIYLLEASSGRQGGLRVLYLWTAPTGVRVGRDAFDDVRRRQLEAAFPQVTFDWTALLASLAAARQQAAVSAANDARREAWRGAARAGRGARATARAVDEGEALLDAAARAGARVPEAGQSETAAAHHSSEPSGAPARRRRKRVRRPFGEGDAPSVPPAPIIET